LKDPAELDSAKFLCYYLLSKFLHSSYHWIPSNLSNSYRAKAMEILDTLTNSIFTFLQLSLENMDKKQKHYTKLVILDVLFIAMLLIAGSKGKINNLVSFVSPIPKAFAQKKQAEVFGFAPYWTFDNLQNVDFNTLTTMAYFGITVNADGSLLTDDQGYQTYHSDHATQVFKKAHSYGTRVVLTLTQMDNNTITALMDNPQAQNALISEALSEVKSQGIDGINVDFEYAGNPGSEYRNKFSTFIKNLTSRFHAAFPSSYISVSVYATSVKEGKLYDIAALSKSADSIFMMAYDFAVAGSDNAIPTDPLYGYKEGKYWYDISTAVSDFLTQMPASKLILGLPWYGYNYPVNQPAVDAQTLPCWYSCEAQTYELAKNTISSKNTDISNISTGWDDLGKESWKAYYDENLGTWRMIFIEDAKSLSIKSDFAKSKNLGGVGIWALGFDKGTNDLWAVLKDKFGAKLAFASETIQHD